MIPLTINAAGHFEQAHQIDVVTHTYMPMNEYNGITSEWILDMRIDTNHALGEVEKLRIDERMATQKLAEVKREIEELEIRNQELESSIEAVSSELEDLDRSNRNLQRIGREKANAARDLRPKKQHSGYVPVRVDQIRVTAGYNDDTGPIHATVWKTTFETPYSAMIYFADIDEEILTDLKETVLADCDIIFHQCDLSDLPEEYRDKNVVYFHDAHYSQKDRSGLWSICLYSTQQLDLSRMK